MSPDLFFPLCVPAGKWHLGVNCEHRGDHCHHPNQHGFSYFYGLPFTLFNNCVPGQGNDVLADLEHTLRTLTMLLGVGLFTLVRVILCQRSFHFPLLRNDHTEVHLKKTHRGTWYEKKMAELENNMKNKENQEMSLGCQTKRKKLENKELLCRSPQSKITNA